MKTYGPTMQCNSKTLDYVKCSKCPCLQCPQPTSPPIDRLINDRLSVNQTLPQLINMSHKILTYPLQ